MITLKDYIETKGAAAVAKETGVSLMTVCNWRNFAAAPHPIRAAKIIKKSNGVLTWKSIYQPYVKAQFKNG